MLRLTGITKRYDGKAVVDEVSLEVPAGETLAVIGPSGCGKSTLLRIVNGLIEPERGTIVIGATELSQTNARHLRQNIGYVVQGGGLFPHLTARGNVGLAARVNGWPRRRIDDRIEELAELVQLDSKQLGRYPRQLSGGQNQRVSLMRALMLDPALLLMDEPLAALDPMVRAELQQDLRSLFERLQKTVVFVTHDLAEAQYISTRIVLVNQGRVIQIGTLEDLVANPANAFVSRFVAAYRVPQVLAGR